MAEQKPPMVARRSQNRRWCTQTYNCSRCRATGVKVDDMMCNLEKLETALGMKMDEFTGNFSDLHDQVQAASECYKCVLKKSLGEPLEKKQMWKPLENIMIESHAKEIGHQSQGGSEEFLKRLIIFKRLQGQHEEAIKKGDELRLKIGESKSISEYEVAIENYERFMEDFTCLSEEMADGLNIGSKKFEELIRCGKIGTPDTKPSTSGLSNQAPPPYEETEAVQVP
ncbi:unnamed protein product, partial [Mesorhabditis spiculigera]